MKIEQQRTFTLTITEEEAKALSRALDAVAGNGSAPAHIFDAAEGDGN